MGDWQPDAAFYAQLIAKETEDADVSRPYPFFLAYPLEGTGATGRSRGLDRGMEVGRDPLADDPARWQTFIWSRGEELVTERFPELAGAGRAAAGRHRDRRRDSAVERRTLPLPFAQMQRRIGRKVLGPKILADVPVVLLAYDLLEWGGEDIREWPTRDGGARS